MIELRESKVNGLRLFNTETGRFVENNAHNRFNAFFGVLVKNEIRLAKNGKQGIPCMSVAELKDNTYYVLIDYERKELTPKVIEEFFKTLDETFMLENKVNDKNFQKLAVCVLADQNAECTMVDESFFEEFDDEYRILNDEIFEEARETIFRNKKELTL